MTDTNTTQTNLVTLKARFDALAERGNNTAMALQETIPLTGKSAKAQEAFLLAVSDMQLLQTLCKTANNTFNGLNLEALTAEQRADAGELASALAELAEGLIDALVENFGVAKEIVMATVATDLGRQLDLIETIVARMEASLAEVTA